MDTSISQVLRPQPRRPGNLSLTPISSHSSDASVSEQSPEEQLSEPELIEYMDIRSNHHMGIGGKPAAPRLESDSARDEGQAPVKTRSFINLTGSTLFGIYSPTGYEPNRDDPLTPFGTGAQTPARVSSNEIWRGMPVFTAEAFKEKAAIGKEREKERRKSIHQQRKHWRRPSAMSQIVTFLLRASLLFAFGIAYGEVITQLHNSGRVAPVQVNQIDRSSGLYLTFWGMTGTLLGTGLPYLDKIWGGSHSRQEDDNAGVLEDDEEDSQEQQLTLGTDWGDVVRSIGAFVGIAFAIRKLSWQSTLQVSLTLALVNPVIWYLIDRTRTGFTLSSVFGLIGASVLLGVNPEWVPAPATASPSPHIKSPVWDAVNLQRMQPDLLAGLVSYDQIGVATWISSVLFCSCIFFGNIGRRVLPEKR